MWGIVLTWYTCSGLDISIRSRMRAYCTDHWYIISLAIFQKVAYRTSILVLDHTK